MKKIFFIILLFITTNVFADNPAYMEGSWITEDGSETWLFEQEPGKTNELDTYANAEYGYVTVTNLATGYSMYYSYRYKHGNFFIQWAYNTWVAYVFSVQMDGDVRIPRAQYTEIGMDLSAPRVIADNGWTIEKRTLLRME